MFTRKVHLEILAKEAKAVHAYYEQIRFQQFAEEHEPEDWREPPEFVVGACLVIARSRMKRREFNAWLKENGLGGWRDAGHLRGFPEIIG